MMLSTLLGAALLQTSTPPSEPITLLVNYHSRPDDAELDWYRAQGATIKYRYSIIPTLAVIADESLIESITDRPNLHYIEEDTSYEIFDIDNIIDAEKASERAD